MYSTVTEDTFV